MDDAMTYESDTHGSPIDLQLVQQRGVDMEMIRTILPVFLYENGQHLNRLNAAYAARDFEGLRIQAHTIKGSAANIGALPLSEAALALQQACREQLYDEIPKLLEKIEQESGRVAAFFETKM